MKPDILANSLNTLLYPVQLNRNLSPWPGLGVVILPHLLQYLHLGAAQDGPPSGPSQQGHPAIQDFISSSNFPYPLLSPTLSFLRNIWNEKESLLFYVDKMMPRQLPPHPKCQKEENCAQYQGFESRKFHMCTINYHKY